MGERLDLAASIAVAFPFVFVVAAAIAEGLWWVAGMIAPPGNEMAQLAIAAVLLLALTGWFR